MLNQVNISVGMATFFLTVVGGETVFGKIPPEVFILYVAASLITFLIYAIDKNAAQKGTRRTPEANLHFLSLVGGWPGALVAQQSLRHKTKKQPFRRIFWLTAILNCCGFVYIHSHKGAIFIEQILSAAKTWLTS